MMTRADDGAGTSSRAATLSDGIALQLPEKMQLSDAVASVLRDLIMAGQLHGGQFLRVDRLAQAFQVSATPVREALMSLKGEGFVQLAPRRGFVVLPLTEHDIRDLFLAQAQIAGELAARSTHSIQPDELEAVVRHQEELRAAAAAHDLEGIERANHSFHKAINRAARSDKLAWLLSVSLRYVPRQTYPQIEGWPQASVADHEAIVEAFRQRDPRKAEAAMTAHITHAGELLIEHLRGTGRLES
jgi:DNA-binding GntR family transcriptional regulator